MTVLGWTIAAVAASLLGSGASFAQNVPWMHPGVHAQVRNVGLGKILNTLDGGQIFGFDINQKGDDGALASSQTIDPSGNTLVSVETFNQNTGAITKSFAIHQGKRHSYSFDGIFANDVGLVTHYVTPPNSIYAIRYYDVMNPVTAQEFTGAWTPPIHDIDVLMTVENQATSKSVVFAIELKNQDQPDLIVSDIAANTFDHIYHLDPSLFGGGNGPRLGEFNAANEAVIALSPDGGRVGGAAPLNVLIDLHTGKTTKLTGLNNGPFGAGYVNGLAVDPNTGIAATTTELNAQVEFYDLVHQTATAVQLPCSGPADQGLSGAGIAVDPVNKLFLVSAPFYCHGNQGSALVVYDEHGSLVETITGFKFAIAEPAAVLNPSKRMGWAFGPAFSQLQQFFY
jgi:hypothetical protein